MSNCGTETTEVADWLARAHPVPRQAEAEWADHGVALLPLGERFDAVRVPAPRIHAAVGSDQHDVVAAVLGHWLNGPVVRDVRTGSGRYYVLVAPDSPWDMTEDRLGKGVYLAVPRVGRKVSPVTYWAVPPERLGQLCDPAHLTALLSTADPQEVLEP
ncbi:hypothetical protein [Streptomyces silvensis]|uniref:DNA primase/polymerase bifunctional N-terminal domain-containing protein n=1 Tax=Streptomyces silvensis TaxID=1765722 RepID=A0A0W7X9T2_9ACTN|nr:hypothetical protein [Streptomyces silvensis]KUF19678.1 hypothetical protein AT728_04780 [Streptomyces silvensis]